MRRHVVADRTPRARALAPFGRRAPASVVAAGIDRRPSRPTAANPGELVNLLRYADTASRQRMVGELQERHGNAGVASLLASTQLGAAALDALESLADGVAEVLTAGEEPSDELPIPTSSGTQIVVDNAPFDVSGTFTTVANQLAAREEAGSVTHWVKDIYLEPEGADPVTLANVTVQETISLPNWQDRPAATDREKKEWDRFRTALAAHEAQHVDLDKAEFTDIHKKMLRKTHAKANAEIDKAEARAELTNDEFDTKTNHGKLAGTSIDLAAAEPKDEKKPG